MAKVSGLRLSHSLRLATEALAQDPLDLNLPPAGGAGSGLTPATVVALAGLYLQSELEQAGIVPAAEALVDARATLDLPNEATAQRLEQYAQQSRNWYDRQSRNSVFARVFGTGAAATPDAGINHDFEQRLATLCVSINRYGSDQVGNLPAPAVDETQVRQAADDLLGNLALRQFGNTLFAVRRIQDQLQASVELLKAPEIGTLFHVKGFWAVVKRILEPNVPDIARLVERGQSGQHLLGWLAASLSALGSDTALLNLNSQVFTWAASWLGASGVTSIAPAERRVA